MALATPQLESMDSKFQTCDSMNALTMKEWGLRSLAVVPANCTIFNNTAPGLIVFIYKMGKLNIKII